MNLPHRKIDADDLIRSSYDQPKKPNPQKSRAIENSDALSETTAQ
jgi:hypothetical protein